MRDEVKITYYVQGNPVECTHVMVHLPTKRIVPMPNEDLGWFFTDQVAMHADSLDMEALSEFMDETREWAEHVLIEQELIPWHRWKAGQRTMEESDA